MRPLLVYATGTALGAREADLDAAAAAVELVHGYSLVHDDLPAMDDDDTRRGRPTVHRAYDEATAILAGDSLLTLAFDVMADPATHPDGAVRAALVQALARASGLGGMAGGQMLDLAAEGRFATGANEAQLGEFEILRLQAMKTGALLGASVTIGAVLGRSPVRFEEAAVAADSRGVVDRLGALALRCPAARLSLTATVTGTDPARAGTLGEARARNVAAAFADIGIDPARIVTSGAADGVDGLSIHLATP